MPISNILNEIHSEDTRLFGGEAIGLTISSAMTLCLSIYRISCSSPADKVIQEKYWDDYKKLFLDEGQLQNDDIEQYARPEKALDNLVNWQQYITKLIQEDKDTYQLVVNANKLPEYTQEQKSNKIKEIDYALNQSTDVILRMMDVCYVVLKTTHYLSKICKSHWYSDLIVIANLLSGAINATATLAEHNIEYMKCSSLITEKRIYKNQSVYIRFADGIITDCITRTKMKQ